jgi:hypothetical protein
MCREFMVETRGFAALLTMREVRGAAAASS